MVPDPPEEVLFLRLPPPGLVTERGRRNSAVLQTLFSAGGYSGSIDRWRITCFWIGFGRRVRLPGPGLLERIRGGVITDILDIGCAGALDPSLRRGDLVLSNDDYARDADTALSVRRRPELRAVAAAVAETRGAAFRTAPILTHDRGVLKRSDRLEQFECTGCAAVQMEHAWFLRLLQSFLPEEAWRRLRVAHLVLVTDAVPRREGTVGAALSTWDAVGGYAFGGRGGIASVRREFLHRWLKD